MVSLAKMSAAGQRSAIGRALHTRANASGPRCVEACRAAVDACVQPGRYHDVQPRRPFLSTRRPAPHPKDAGERTRRCGDVGRDKKINAAAGSTPTPARTACVAPPSMRRSTNVRRAVTHRGVGRSQVNADHFLGADVERSARRNNAASGGFRAELLPGNVTAAAGDAGGGRGVEYSLSAHCGVRGGGGRELKRRSGDVCRDAARSADPERFRDEETKNVSPRFANALFFLGRWHKEDRWKLFEALVRVYRRGAGRAKQNKKTSPQPAKGKAFFDWHFFCNTITKSLYTQASSPQVSPAVRSPTARRGTEGNMPPFPTFRGGGGGAQSRAAAKTGGGRARDNRDEEDV